jgi:hypothetical protein
MWKKTEKTRRSSYGLQTVKTAEKPLLFFFAVDCAKNRQKDKEKIIDR